MDTALLRYHISKNNMNLQEYAKELGVSYNALYKKMSKKNGFSVSEIKITIKCLNLKEQDFINIFFVDLFPKVN